MTEPPITSETIRIRKADGQPVEGRLTYFPDYGRRVACVILDVPVLGRFEVREYDYFECLLSLRRRLEPLGAKLLCWGARRDVWPSGMQRDMGDGLTAYRLSDGAEGRKDEQLIFSPAADEVVATVDEQRQFAEAWFARRTGPANPPLQRTGAAGILSAIRKWFGRGPGH